VKERTENDQGMLGDRGKFLAKGKREERRI